MHIARKATNSTPTPPPRRYHRARRIPGSDFSLPLLSDDDDSELSSEEEEIFHPGMANGQRRSRSFRDFDDEFYLKDNREWTSIRDSHLSMKDLASAAETIPAPKVLMEQSKSAPDLEQLADIGLSSD